LYLAEVLDLYSRRVIGWAMAAIQDEALIEQAFQMALLARHPPAGVLFHSDRSIPVMPTKLCLPMSVLS
jgi:putative transposase